ncbi:hemin-degrading factor [Marinomonas epiphytica]
MNLNEYFDRPCMNKALVEQYIDYKKDHPRARQRDIAASLGVPEAELVSNQLGLQSVYLNGEFSDLLKDLPELGYVMILMRNEFAVHERKGIYENVKVGGPMGMGLIISSDNRIDLRLFLRRWKHGFAVRERLENGERYSLQFFDAKGIAIQKLYLQENSDISAFERLLAKYRHTDQRQEITFDETSEVIEYTDSEKVDQQALREDWSNMTDVHQFVGLLKKYGVSREQAFAIVGDQYAQPFEVSKLKAALVSLAQEQVPIMCFVGNNGGIQIHSGEIHRVVEKGDWLNILDPEFSLHLLMSGVTKGWLVRKPTSDGIITSLELYDQESQQVAQFFGKRIEKSPENLAWRQVAEATLVA